MPEKRIDWESLKREFIYGCTQKDIKTGISKIFYPTFQELAEKYNCAVETINHKSQNDPIASWSKQRAKIKEKLCQKLNNEEINLVLSDSAKYDLTNLQLVNNTFKLLQEFFHPYTEYFNDRDSFAEAPPRVSVKELESISRMLLNLHTLVRNIESEPINNAEIMKELIKQDIQESDRQNKELRKKKMTAFLKKQQEKEKRKEKLIAQQEEIELKLLEAKKT